MFGACRVRWEWCNLESGRESAARERDGWPWLRNAGLDNRERKFAIDERYLLHSFKNDEGPGEEVDRRATERTDK